MFQRDFDNKTKAGCRLSRQTEGQQALADSPLRHDPLAQIAGRAGNPGSINAHAAILNRATASRPSQARHALLQLQRQYGNRYVQRVLDLARKGEGNAEVSPEVEQAIQRARGNGQALDSGVRTQMEAAFGVDFSGVRVHTGSEADGLNRVLNARAFTTGQDIFFRQGEYNPGGSGGQKLLAHELTHVVQQGGVGVQGKLTVSQPGDRYEVEADWVAEEVMRMPDSENFGISESASRIQKKCAACSNGSGKDFCPKCEEERIQRKPRFQRKPASNENCPPRERGEIEDSRSSRFHLMERSRRQEWLIYDFRVGSSTIEPAKGDITILLDQIVRSLAKGHFVYVVGQDPVEILAYTDCHGSPTINEQLRNERAANFCSAVQSSYFSETPRSFERFIRSCRAAPEQTYVTSNSTKEGRSQNRSVLIRVLPPSAEAPTSSFPYDDEYGPTERNCAPYKAAAEFLNQEYAQNAYCACTHTPDEPHNNCVRRCLQSKLWRFVAANARDLREGRFIWCPSIWRHHRECYDECGCDNRFIDFRAFLFLCTEGFPCPAVGLSIALFNKCMET